MWDLELISTSWDFKLISTLKVASTQAPITQALEVSVFGGVGASLSMDQIAFINKRCGIELNIGQINFIHSQGKEEELKGDPNRKCALEV